MVTGTSSVWASGYALEWERDEGTSGSLFLTPASRAAVVAGYGFGSFIWFFPSFLGIAILGWLTGARLNVSDSLALVAAAVALVLASLAAGLVETTLAAVVTIIFGRVAFGVTFDPNYPALALSFALFLASLWGLGFVFSALGLILKRSNDLANLLSSFVGLLGGVYYPVALLPSWLRYPAEALPLGYGIQAMVGSSLHHDGLVTLAPQLIPLAGFAVALPVIGIMTFAWLERKARQRGELDLY